MLFVLAGRREAPPARQCQQEGRAGQRDPRLDGRRLPLRDHAAISPTGVFLFLLNSSGAVILFVYGPNRRFPAGATPAYRSGKAAPEDGLFPYLTIAAIVAMLAILVGMYMGEATRSQLLLSLLAWGIVLVSFAANKWRPEPSRRLPRCTCRSPAPPACWCSPTRPSVLRAAPRVAPDGSRTE